MKNETWTGHNRQQFEQKMHKKDLPFELLQCSMHEKTHDEQQMKSLIAGPTVPTPF